MRTRLGSTLCLALGVALFGAPGAAAEAPGGAGDGTLVECQPNAGEEGACPAPVTLRVRAEARKRSILLRVRPSDEASVFVYGQVGWNFKPKGWRGKKSEIERMIVALDGGTKDVSPGATTRFTIRLPKSVKLRLSRLTRRASVRAKLTLRATNAAGIDKNTRLRVKLRGWRQPR